MVFKFMHSYQKHRADEGILFLFCFSFSLNDVIVRLHHDTISFLLKFLFLSPLNSISYSHIPFEILHSQFTLLFAKYY